ncbi:DUF5672 family protein [Pseudemcibacter aquimaris]|uniref:DUF5672 family protein n=1 Tax=Pseudemcibacter aquimaris TaxID=2857064 RepID=UPI0020128050|nr:DUF5672 family protein [Pseudemcibacter aquimaris]MCC3862332.1 hypothetical protein [Pseudemcibacter aquimaris]WDU59237.1 hypothetical protein KW060_03005 [Pseudemcibacter aquimaris]
MKKIFSNANAPIDLNGKLKNSSAQIIYKILTKQGVCRENIVGSHIAHMYNSLRTLSSVPDFQSIVGILPNQRKHELGEDVPVLGVIVETREHPQLSFVIENVIENTGIPVQLFHGEKNLEFILNSPISKWIKSGQVHLTLLNTDELCARKYNALFLSKEFWHNVRGRKKILIFQTDAIICSNSEYSLDDFQSYDYIGSKWNRNRTLGLIIDGGNGGLSLRDWSKTYECIERFPAEFWRGGEDGYFAFHIDLIGGKVGREDECAKFSTQYQFLYNSFGAHQLSCLIEKTDREAFKDYCPESAFMI